MSISLKSIPRELMAMYLKKKKKIIEKKDIFFCFFFLKLDQKQKKKSMMKNNKNYTLKKKRGERFFFSLLRPRELLSITHRISIFALRFPSPFKKKSVFFFFLILKTSIQIFFSFFLYLNQPCPLE